MSISGINPTSFRGRFAIQHKCGINCFNTDAIKKFIVNGKKRGVFIAGKDVSGVSTRVFIPQKAISEDKVTAAYKAACDMNGGTVVLKIDKDCFVKSGK